MSQKKKSGKTSSQKLKNFNLELKMQSRGYLGVQSHKYQLVDLEPKPGQVSGYEYLGSHDNQGRRDGKGYAWFENGDFYSGNYKGGVRHGKGIYVYDKKGHYVGEWNGGMRHGLGAYYFTNGGIFIGNWVEDQRNGRGEYYYRNNDYFIGEFENNLRHGRGRFYHAQPDVMFRGRWKENVRQPNGEVQEKGTFVRPKKRPDDVWKRMCELRAFPKKYDSIISLNEGRVRGQLARREPESEEDSSENKKVKDCPPKDVVRRKTVDERQGGKGEARPKSRQKSAPSAKRILAEERSKGPIQEKMDVN